MDSNLKMLEVVGQVSRELNIDFMVVGAYARDCFLETVEGISLPRKTLDVDIACSVHSWEEYSRLIAALVDTGKFSVDSKISHRLLFQSENVPLDIIPFGGIEDSDGAISWPPDFDSSMSVLGFCCAYQSALGIEKEGIDFKVINPALFALLKLQAWSEDSSRTKDLKDFYYIADNYFEIIDADKRVYDDGALDVDILDEDDFDIVCAGARLIGRDVARVDKEVCLRIVTGLKEEDVYASLVENLSRVVLNSKLTLSLRIVEALFQGISEI